MEEVSLSKQLTSLEEISQILRIFRRPTRDEMDKKAFKALLSGFQVIVNSLENDKNSVNLEEAIEWFRLYMKARMLILNSDTKLSNFSKTVPIAITYVIGWLQHAPDHDGNFFTEVMNMAYKLVCMTDPTYLKKLEEYGQGVISMLWNVIDKARQYNTQLQALKLFTTILYPLDKDFIFWEVKNLPCVKGNEIVYKILELLRIRYDENLFKKLARSILNQHNSQKDFDVHVQSFYCKTLEIGNNMKFLKGTYADRFWFDINENPLTLSFEGRIAPKYSRIYQNLNVSLTIKKMLIDKGKLYVTFMPPAKMLGAKIDDKDIFNEDVARISLSKSELSRFVKIFGEESSLRNETSFISVNSTKCIFDRRNNKAKITFMPSKSSLSTVPTVDLSSDSPFSKLKNSISMKVIPANEFNNTFVQNDALESFDRNTTPEIEDRNQFQYFSNRQQSVSDEYENINVSDAEPCQSYRNFQTRKPEVDNGKTRPITFQPIKPCRKNAVPQSYPNTIYTLDSQFRTLKKIPKMRKSKKRAILENEFDKVKNGSASKIVCSLRGGSDDSENDVVTHKKSSKSTTIENVFDLTIDCEKTQSKLINPRTPERSQHVIASASISSFKKPSLVSYEYSQAVIPFTRKTEDCLVYHKRSDIDSSSDESNSSTRSTPKRKSVDSIKRTAKKRLFDLSLTNTMDSDTDYNVTEFVFVGKQNIHANMSVINTALSSMFQQHNSRPTFRKHRKVRILTDM